MSEFDKMVDFLDVAWAGRSQLVPCLEGPVGIGKTAAVLQHAKNVKAGKVVTIIASQILPNEVSGITMPVTETKSMEIFDHFRLSSLEDGDILFFDELLEADQLVLSACLTLIESRQMMSGRKLPDIQIVAATNATVKPNMLKENIRQRFVWRKFDIDREGCRKYIEKTYGFDPGYDVCREIRATGNEYNILTQRSLTKMSYWMSLSKSDEEADQVASQINMIWGSQLGSKLKSAWLKRYVSPEAQVRRAIKDILDDIHVESISDESFSFEDVTIEELVDLLQSLPEWDDISEKLSKLQIEQPTDDEKIDF